MREEYQIEERFIRKLTSLKYTYRVDIKDKDSLISNFKSKFERLNRVTLTDSEFERLYNTIIDEDIYSSSKRLRDINTFIREDGTPLHYTLVNIKDWCKNDYEVINQLRINTSNSHHRYDVIILINGIPVVQVELKSSTVSPRRAMQQIIDYKNDKGNGYTNTLLCFMQLFIVSNEKDTYYFSNNNNKHLDFNADEKYLPVYKLADENNNKISCLNEFSNRFLPKCTLGEMISRYMVLIDTEQKMLVMRPYQVYAVKRIMDCINDNRGNGYIWHTTGSGKTLTSFKTSTLLKDNEGVDKCLFVVDRKDLDRQTRDEFNKFQEGCVEENTNTERLVKRLLSEDYTDKVIVTTIQKLGIALDPTNKQNYRDRLLELKNKRIIFIFDECHRSQFGKNHEAIKSFFPKSQLFGFTGTPIFEENSVQITVAGEEARYKITEDIFEKLLHSYTITNAIDDENVLGFHIDYFKFDGTTLPHKDKVASKQVIVDSIIEKHYSATNNRRFNSIFATSSINDAITYYNLFKDKQAKLAKEIENYIPLNIACVFSPPAGLSADVKQMQDDLENEKENYKQNPEEKKQALIDIINEYNIKFNTNHSIYEFDTYYKDIQSRIKDQQYSNKDYPQANKIDITIVVDMLLTGFDSKYLNTLYVDKNLRYHGLIQAFSRTNRVLNTTKPHGNILDFRGQQNEVREAIKRFSDESFTEEQAREIWLVDPAPKVIEKFQNAISELNDFMHSEGLECTPEEVYNLKGDIARARFVENYKNVQSLKTKLEQYTDLSEEQKNVIAKLLPEDDERGFKGAYLETAKKIIKKQNGKGDDIPNDIEELDLQLVLFSSAIIDYDYIMSLIAEYGNPNTKSTKVNVTKEQLVSIIKSSSNLMTEREDIIDFIDNSDIQGKNEKEIRKLFETFMSEKFIRLLTNVAKKYSIEYSSLQSFVDNIVNRMIFDDKDLSALLSPLGLGWKDRTQRKVEIMDDLIPILNKIVGNREISGLSVY